MQKWQLGSILEENDLLTATFFEYLCRGVYPSNDKSTHYRLTKARNVVEYRKKKSKRQALTQRQLA